jgi:hypothetical protein
MGHVGKGYDINQTFIIETNGIDGQDIFVTGGTYSAGTAIFTNNSGGTFSVSGLTTPFTGGTVSGSTIFLAGLSATTISGTTYLGLPIDIFVTGGTYSAGTAQFTNNTGGTFSVTGFKTDDVFVTGGTYSAGTAQFINNTGGTFSVSGFLTGQTDTYVTGLTFSNNVLTLQQTNNQANITILVNNFSGLTVNGGISANTISANTISATTYINLPAFSGAYLPLSGGTVTGPTNFISGLTTNTFSAATYLGLPTDIFVTGGTYLAGTAEFMNNTGGTFSVSGFSTGGGSTFTGGTVSGPTSFINGLTANTFSATSINQVDYVVFNTGTTSAATEPGTVYFNNTEKTLSYNTSINQGVTVNLGQQNYIRVFNNSGVDIPRGKALEVLTAYSGLPSVSLAINRYDGFYVIGVSSEIIPNNSEGIAITNGIISDIELTGMTIGTLVYASDSIAGNFSDFINYQNFPLTARTNEIGYVIQTGTTTGKLFVNIINENSVLSLTDLERNVLEGNVISTGTFEYTGMTTSSTTTFNVAPLKGWIVSNTYENSLTPDVQSVNYTGGTSIPVTNIATADSTYVLINSGLTITQQTTFPTPQQRRENIFLGKVNHPNRTSILNINNTVDYDVSPMSSLRDLWSPIKLINQGIIPSPNGANLSFNTSAGTLWGNGINWHNNQLSPNNVSIAAKVPASFFYRTQTGGTSSSVSVIDPRNYDVGGVITSVGNSNSDDATNQRIYMYPTGVINVLYGQTVYANLTAAVAAINSETFIPYPNAESTGILIGVLSVRNDIGTDGEPLTNTNYAKFTLVSKFGESFGGTGGLSTTTLQQAYDNSTTPEIVINAILDGLSVKNGTGNADNVTNVFEAVNTAGATTALIRADGYISGTTFQSNGFTANNNGLTATTVSATTYLGLPTDIRVTGGTYSNGTAEFTNNTGGTFSVSGFSTGGGSSFTGGTVSGATSFTGGLSANTFSATTISGTTLFGNGANLTGIGLPIVNFRGAVTVVQTNVEVAFGYYLIPANTFTTGDIIEIQCTWDPCDFTAASLSTTGIRSFTGNTPTPPSVGQSLANNGASGAATRYVQLQRENLYFSDATTLRVVNSPTLSDVGIISTTAMGTPTFNTAIDNYIYPTMRAGVGTTATLRSFIISKK